jgi:hypothetical protein
MVRCPKNEPRRCAFEAFSIATAHLFQDAQAPQARLRHDVFVQHRRLPHLSREGLEFDELIRMRTCATGGQAHLTEITILLRDDALGVSQLVASTTL